MLLNCGVGEDCSESPVLQGDQTSGCWWKSALNIHWKDWFWSWSCYSLATWWEEVTCWKRPLCCKIEGGRRKGWQRMRWLGGITDSMDMRLGRLRELVIDRKAWCAVVHGVTKNRTRASDWTELNSLLCDPTLTSIHYQWKNHGFDSMGICQWSDISSF